MRRAPALLALLLVAASCGSGAPRPAQRQSALVDVSTVLSLRGAFNRDAGKTRLLVVLSPT